MAAPDHGRAGGANVGSESRGLRVVQDDDVIGVDSLDQLIRLDGEHGLVVMPVRCREILTVARHTVEPVMNALGDGKERVIAVDRQPASIDSCASSIGEQRRQQFSDPAPSSRRVDIPYPPPGEKLLSSLDHLRERRRAGAVQHFEKLVRISLLDWDLGYLDEIDRLRGHVSLDLVNGSGGARFIEPYRGTIRLGGETV